MRFADEDRGRPKALAAERFRQELPARAVGRVPPKRGASDGRGGFQTCDLSRVKNEETADPEAESQP
jgi:hypothetical protein